MRLLDVLTTCTLLKGPGSARLALNELDSKRLYGGYVRSHFFMYLKNLFQTVAYFLLG